MKLKKVLVSWVVLMIQSPCCFALEPRFYGSANKSADEASVVYKIEATADMKLNCVGLDEIDIGIGDERLTNGEKSSGAMYPKYFTRKELHHFLQTERHKNLLVIRFEKPIMWEEPAKVKEILAAYKCFVSDLGYERVLILGGHSSGVYVLYDSGQAPVQK